MPFPSSRYYITFYILRVLDISLEGNSSKRKSPPKKGSIRLDFSNSLIPSSGKVKRWKKPTTHDSILREKE